MAGLMVLIPTIVICYRSDAKIRVLRTDLIATAVSILGDVNGNSQSNVWICFHLFNDPVGVTNGRWRQWISQWVW